MREKAYNLRLLAYEAMRYDTINLVVQRSPHSPRFSSGDILVRLGILANRAPIITVKLMPAYSRKLAIAPFMIDATEVCSRISEEIRGETTGTAYQRDWRG